MNGLTIGKLAKQVGIGIETIRFYERQGLLEPPARTDSNYRIYPETDVGRLRFIKRAKALGFSLKEIRDLLSLRHDPAATKADIKQRTDEKIGAIEGKINDLSRMLETLRLLSVACDGHGPLSECPILEALEGGEDAHCHR